MATSKVRRTDWSPKEAELVTWNPGITKKSFKNL